MTEEFFTVSVLVLLLGCIMGFFHAQTIARSRLGVDEATDITINATSAFLMLLPMLSLLNKNWIRMGSLAACLFFLIWGAKRGNILAAIIPVTLCVWYMLKDSHYSVGKTFFVLIAIAIVGYYTYYWFTTNDYLLQRIESTLAGDSSDRDVIYVNAWNAWLDTSNSFFRLLFGFGYDGTLHHPLMRGSRAHNDWLEVLVNYGLFGVLSYLAIFIAFWRTIRRTKDLQTRLILISSFFIWFFKSLYSMGFSEEYMAIMMISVGSVLGRTNSVGHASMSRVY